MSCKDQIVPDLSAAKTYASSVKPFASKWKRYMTIAARKTVLRMRL